MIPSNNRDGFSFIEVVLTIALIGAVLTPLFSVQYNVFNLLARAADKLSRIFLLENVINEGSYKAKPFAEKMEVIKSNIADPETSIELMIQKPDPQTSPLRKFEHLYIVRSKGSWKRFGLEFNDSVVSLVFQQPPQKKKEVS